VAVAWAVRAFALPRGIGGAARERAGGREGGKAGGGRSGGHSGLVEGAGGNVGDVHLQQTGRRANWDGEKRKVTQ